MSKVFVSYKHRDWQVSQIPYLIMPEYRLTTARNYVDILDGELSRNGHICKAEESGEDLSGLSEETISSKLADRIYDSTVTIVLISKGMHEIGKSQKEQWIPWEVSYSLHENTRGGRTSATNAMIAVVLPDETDSYNYFVTEHNCFWCQATTWHNDKIFGIIGQNMFNRFQPRLVNCQNQLCGKVNLHIGNDHSYIHPIKWKDFLIDINGHISLALQRQEDMESYNIKKELM